MTTTSKIVAASFLGLVLLGCPQPVTPPEDAGTTTCVGQVGCACATGNTCSVGECIAGSCVDCRRGEAACTCRANGTCNTGLRCANAACEACPAGAQGCACGTGDTCNTGLSCTSGTCTPSTCTAGATSCPCRGGTPQCDGTAYCDGTSVCQACSADVLDCPCGAGNVCTGGLTCDATTVKCRTPVTCAALRAAGTCVPNQLCTESAGTDAVCVAGSCVADFTWDSRTNTCAACVSAGCTSEPTCAGGDAGIGDSCTQQHRVCGQSGSIAFCGGCQAGYRENASMVCVLAATCGGVTCAVSEYCDPATNACTPSPCPPGQAKELAGACMACNLACNTEGFNTRTWPFRTAGGECLCETIADYFVAAGGNTLASKCDADGDGWVNDDSQSSADLALRANARCTVRKATTVKLVDEFGIALSLRSCAVEGMISALPDGGQCAAVLELPLLESPRNDVPGQVPDLQMPVYGLNGGADGGMDGGTGRALEVNELNALTKACVNTLGDFNDDGVGDLIEVAAIPPLATPDAKARLASFAYFMELYTSYFEAPGTLVIRERSRCDADFPVHYDPAVSPAAPSDLFDADAGATYWRSCDRRRDPTWDQANPRPNFDFAQWDCAATGGTCPAVAPAHATLTAPVDPNTTLLRDFGLCSLNGSLPADRRWRGMNHHSQFKCVSVTDSPTSNGVDRAPADVSATGPLVLNQCAARPCSGPTDPTCRQTQGAGAQTHRPVLDCTALAAGTAGTVGLAAVRYQPYGPAGAGYTVATYRGSCVNEDVESQLSTGTFLTWLCPDPEYSNVYSAGSGIAAGQKAKSDAAFGRYSCSGDLKNFLWAPAFSPRATLGWAPGVGDTANGFFR